jgi:hypothetical protein
MVSKSADRIHGRDHLDLQRIKFTQFVHPYDVTVNHVDDFQLVPMQFVGGRGAAVIDDDHIEAFVGQAAHR